MVNFDKKRSIETAAWILVVCAVISTSLVIYREVFRDPVDSTGKPVNLEASYVDGWEGALDAGLRSGSGNAPIQVVEFVDFQCPYCARFEPTVQLVRDTYSDLVAFTFVHLPLPSHPFATAAALAAECAHHQGRFEAMRSLLFQKQQAIGSESWVEFARQASIPDIEQFNMCMDDSGPLGKIEHSAKIADELGVLGTPTIIINGWKMPVAPTPEDFDVIVDNVLNGKHPGEDLDFLSAYSRN